jgi:hypothetical protein
MAERFLSKVRLARGRRLLLHCQSIEIRDQFFLGLVLKNKKPFANRKGLLF